MRVLATYDGTAASETALCDSCFEKKENRLFARECATQADDIDHTSEFVDCSGNEALECQICGKHN